MTARLQDAAHALTFTARAESWPLAEAFVISRGAKTAADVVVVEASLHGAIGRGEAVPYARYGETSAGVMAALSAVTAALAARSQAPGADIPSLRRDLQDHLPAGAARNAIDCALWDLEAKLTGVSVARRLDRTVPPQCLTAYTLSLDSPDRMATKACLVAHLPLLKLKLGGEGDAARIHAVRAARPDARLIADANESWTIDLLPELMAVAAQAGIECIEQPLPASLDAALRDSPRGVVAVCADESLHTRADLPRLVGLYDAINIKLDKAGGLTEAHALVCDAHAAGLKIMVGCMVATSLAMAPALLLAGNAHWVDLDGPLLLARDRENSLTIHDGIITPAPAALWG